MKQEVTIIITKQKREEQYTVICATSNLVKQVQQHTHTLNTTMADMEVLSTSMMHLRSRFQIHTLEIILLHTMAE